VTTDASGERSLLDGGFGHNSQVPHSCNLQLSPESDEGRAWLTAAECVSEPLTFSRSKAGVIHPTKLGTLFD
jgi:hypothetical protein